MVKSVAHWGFVLFAASLFSACGGGGHRLDLEVKARMDGRPVASAKVMVDGQERGVTDGSGVFAGTLERKPGTEVEVLVAKELPGYRIKPWKTSFLVKLPKDGAVDKYSFDADLQATRYFTLVVTEKGAPVAEATVNVNDKEVGKTDAGGELVYDYKELPKKGVTLTVSKTGYAAWRKTGEPPPGQRLEVALSRRTVVNVTALTEEYGHTSGVAGVAVSIDGRAVGEALGDFRRAVAIRRAGDGGTEGEALGALADGPQEDPGVAGVALIVHPGVEVIGDPGLLEACLLGQHAHGAKRCRLPCPGLALNTDDTVARNEDELDGECLAFG